MSADKTDIKKYIIRIAIVATISIVACLLSFSQI